MEELFTNLPAILMALGALIQSLRTQKQVQSTTNQLSDVVGTPSSGESLSQVVANLTAVAEQLTEHDRYTHERNHDIINLLSANNTELTLIRKVLEKQFGTPV